METNKDFTFDFLHKKAVKSMKLKSIGVHDFIFRIFKKNRHRVTLSLLSLKMPTDPKGFWVHNKECATIKMCKNAHKKDLFKMAQFVWNSLSLLCTFPFSSEKCQITVP